MKQEYLKRIIKLEKEVETIKDELKQIKTIIAKQQEQINKLLKLNNVA